MDPVDRIAAYLAGDLDTAEAAAVSEELARDPELRAQVAAMRRADEALGGLESPRPSAGFEQRLRERLDPVLAQELQGSGSPAAESGTSDDLANRRARRDRGRGLRWMPALAGAAAAALAVLVVVNLGSADDDSSGDVMTADMPDADLDAADDGMEMQAEAEESDDAAAMDMAGPPDGPIIVASGRQLDETDLERLLDDPELQDVAAQHWGEDHGADVAGYWSGALGVEQPIAESDDTDEPAVEEDAAEPEADVFMGEANLRHAGPLTDEDRAAVSRCLEHVADEERPGIPADVELGTFHDEDVIVFGFVSLHPDTGAFTRSEVWVVARSDCEVRDFRQN